MSTILVILTAVVNSLWQALAVAVLVWLALRFMPRINAATRYAIWWATLGVVLMLPVAPRLILLVRAHPKTAAVTAVKTPGTVAPAVTVEPVMVTVVPGRTAIWPIMVLIVWAGLLLWRLFQIVRSYFYLRGVKRRAAVSLIPLPAIPRRADFLISPDIVSPMAVGFLRPAIILPESLLEELSEPEREHVLLHESAHLAKYDDWSNLAMRLLAGALALHPVAIWILWRIEREREMACDDWVVARTGAARPYAASLAHLFELRRARRDEMLASGLFGSRSRVGDRIEMLLRRGRTFSPRASATGVAASTVVLGALLLAGSFAPRWIAFAQQQARLTFDVASIKPNNAGSPTSGGVGNGGASERNVTLKFMVALAWRLQEFQISGGPVWVGSDRFDVEAKAADRNADAARLRLMLQSLLADRFQLKFHRETKESSVYALVVGKDGLKMKPSADQISPDVNGPSPRGAGPNHGAIRIGAGSLIGNAVTLPLFTRFLSQRLDRTIVDRTNLGGRFDIRLQWTPSAGENPLSTGGDALPPADSSGPSIFSAIQEQLGLKLESAKEPVEMLVIDHVEKADAN